MPFKSKTDNLVHKKNGEMGAAPVQRPVSRRLCAGAGVLLVAVAFGPANLAGRRGAARALRPWAPVAALARHLPLQNVLFAAFAIALAGGAVICSI